jgi:outer membrane protein assembly factor BamB
LEALQVLSYEQPYVPLILNGRIIYSEHPPTSSSVSQKFGTYCLDLYTGEEIWFLEDVVINFAQVLSFDSPNEHGLIPHLWTQSGSSSNTTYNIHDGFTGEYIFTITNASRGLTSYGPEGEILSYSIAGSGNNRRLILWNSTKAILDSGTGGTPPPRQFERYSPQIGTICDGSYGIEFNVSIPDIPGPLKYLDLEEGILMTHTIDPTTFPFTFIEAAFDTTTGQFLWRKDITDIHGHYAPVRLPYSPSGTGDGIRVMYDDSKTQLHAYSLDNGDEIWVADVPSNGWTYFDQCIDIAYGNVYIAGYDGHVRAYDTQTGDLSWDFYQGDAGFETAYGTWPIYAGFTIADEKIFFSNDDHSPDSVLWRGGQLYAVDTNDGQKVWSISGWFRIPAIADGYLTSVNSLDGMIYTFGKGPSETTVTASPKVSVHGSSVLIEGTVLDMSPAQPGAACVSDESMSAWMEYLHMQKPVPSDVIGVTVNLDVFDPNGNVVNIGTATTDMTGTFGMAFTPEVPGLYQVIATFAGSESYGSSFAQTYLNVEEAPEQEPSPTPTPAPMTDTYLVGSTIAILAGISIAVFLLLRKK